MNVLGTVRTVQALLPRLIASGRGLVVLMGSTAGRIAYENGGSYVAAKHAVAAVAGTLRLELCGEPVRVTEIAPGMVRTDEFAVNRFGGDAERAAAVYAGVAEPLTADDVAETVAWVATLPVARQHRPARGATRSRRPPSTRSIASCPDAFGTSDPLAARIVEHSAVLRPPESMDFGPYLAADTDG